MNIKKTLTATMLVASSLAFALPMLVAADNAVPTLTSISPSFTTVGGSSFTLTVNGTGFVSGAMINFNGNPKTTSYVSSNQLTATIPAADLTTAGAFNVTVTNPSPGGGTSSPMTFTVNTSGNNNPIPTLLSISPTSRPSGSGSFTLTANGVNFVPGSVLKFNGISKATTYVSSNQVTASILASDIIGARTDAVSVMNPGPGGGDSNPLLFTISSSTSNTTPTSTPTLPNTGFGPDQPQTSLNFGTLAASLALVLLASVTLWSMHSWAKRQ